MNKLRLYERICRKFPVVHQTFEVGDVRFEFLSVDSSFTETTQSPLTSQSNFQSETCEENAPRNQPYWMQLWESTIGICKSLAREELAGKSVLDLGCGLGIAGAYMAARGAVVTLADAVPNALMFARYNTWFEGERTRVQLVDWHVDNLAMRFDLIIGADILYDQDDWQPLADFWQQHLKPGASVILSEPGRSTGRTFLDWIDTNTWSVESSKISVMDFDHDIGILRLSRKQM